MSPSRAICRNDKFLTSGKWRGKAHLSGYSAFSVLAALLDTSHAPSHVLALWFADLGAKGVGPQLSLGLQPSAQRSSRVSCTLKRLINAKACFLFFNGQEQLPSAHFHLIRIPF